MSLGGSLSGGKESRATLRQAVESAATFGNGPENLELTAESSFSGDFSAVSREGWHRLNKAFSEVLMEAAEGLLCEQ